MTVAARRRRARYYRGGFGARRPALYPVRKVEVDPFDTATATDERAMAAAVLALLRSLPGATNASGLERQVRGLGTAKIDDPDVGRVQARMLRVLRRAAQDTLSAQVTVKATARLAITFDLDDPAAIAWAEQRSASMVVEITKRQREAIRALIRRALAEGGHPYVIARQIRPLIGLHSRWATAVLNYRYRLEAAGQSVSAVERATARYYAKLLRTRAQTIARTEILTAANRGKFIGWDQAYRDGHLGTVPPSKRWDAGAGACPSCVEADGQEVAMYDVFSTNLGTFEMPPAHPDCRCTASLIVAEAAVA